MSTFVYMKKTITPAYIASLMKNTDLDSLVIKTGYSMEVIKACIDTCDMSSFTPVQVSSLLGSASKVPSYPGLSNPNYVADLLLTKTIKEIAELHNVSSRTVSRYISKHCIRTQYVRGKAGDFGRPTVIDLLQNSTLTDFCDKYLIDKEDIISLFKIFK